MQISTGKVVSIDYTLTNDEGDVIDTSSGGAPLCYLQGGGNIIAGLEKELEGRKAGDAIQARVEPEEGYGKRDESLIMKVPMARFHGVKAVEKGMQFQASTASGPQLMTVVEITEGVVTVDGNHPLAGTTLNFDVTVREVRDATAEEQAHGHVHGPGGHHH